MLAALGAAGVVVAVVTGRAPDVAARLAGLTDAAASISADAAASISADAAASISADAGLRRLVVHGHYGLQSWSAEGGLTSAADPVAVAAVDRVRSALPALLRGLAAPAGVVVEDKVIAIAVHTRQAADPQGAIDAIAPALVELAGREGLQTEAGRYVREIRPTGVDKGATLGRLIDAAAAVAVLYAGDDLGDLPAFAALSVARAAGTATVGLASGQQDTDPRVEAAADITVDGPTGVLAVLRRLADQLR